MSLHLYDYQEKAVANMKNGCILCGGVGSGKSRTSLAYYYQVCGGDIHEDLRKLDNAKDLYVITTARKRDTGEWLGDMAPFCLTPDKEHNPHGNKVVIDSWNNIKKYVDVKNAFFIFDEQRVVGYGAWTKTFLKITRNNDWILLSATPGDKWEDYIPVFIANGFYKNKTEFVQNHMQMDYTRSFPRVLRYFNTGRLIRLRNKILVDMDFDRPTTAHHEAVYCEYNSFEYKMLCKERWNKEKDEPIETASELCYTMRKIVNSDPSRLTKILEIYEEKERVIIFYNFDYELELLREMLTAAGITFSEWNGHKHEDIPSTDKWAYLVQYTSGAEGWNCVKTDTIIFYSQNYSYKMMQQASGRIDRLNTPYHDLYYYHLKSRSGIDIAIGKALSSKKTFNESRFING